MERNWTYNQACLVIKLIHIYKFNYANFYTYPHFICLQQILHILYTMPVFSNQQISVFPSKTRFINLGEV